MVPVGGMARAAGLAGCLLVSGFFVGVFAQQVPDTAFRAEVGSPAYSPGQGPVVAIDGAHNNFHTADGGYAAFANVLRQDGFQVRSLDEPFAAASLMGVDVLVIANALAEDDLGAWVLPNPSAFTAEEIAFVRQWVEEGGSMFLIADHMPFPGAAGDLAEAFEVKLLNGFAMNPGRQGPIIFRKSDGTLAEHLLTEGVDSVASFTGEAMEAPEDATILLRLPEGTVSLQPDTAWAFHPDTPSVDVSGWAQGLVSRVGQGRVAVFGEAAMFAAQLAGPQSVRVGMNTPVAAGNAQLLMNVVRWLAAPGTGSASPRPTGSTLKVPSPSMPPAPEIDSGGTRQGPCGSSPTW